MPSWRSVESVLEDEERPGFAVFPLERSQSAAQRVRDSKLQASATAYRIRHMLAKGYTALEAARALNVHPNTVHAEIRRKRKETAP